MCATTSDVRFGPIEDAPLLNHCITSSNLVGHGPIALMGFINHFQAVLIVVVVLALQEWRLLLLV
jgi:hypothetical protein